MTVAEQHFKIHSTWDGNTLTEKEMGFSFSVMTGFEDYFELQIESPFFDDPKPSGKPGFTDLLWEFEVIEWFIASSDSSNYIELEFSPHGHHLAYAFNDVRMLDKELRKGLTFHASIQGTRWSGHATIPKCWLPAGKVFRHNFYAIHGVKERRYLVMDVLGGEKPDFHQPRQFGSSLVLE